jgi:large subunit ribosomal protein L23
MQNLNRPGAREQPTAERSLIAEQAQALLSGKEAWKQTPAKDEWVDVGEPEEVETDVDVSPRGVSQSEKRGE